MTWSNDLFTPPTQPRNLMCKREKQQMQKGNGITLFAQKTGRRASGAAAHCLAAATRKPEARSQKPEGAASAAKWPANEWPEGQQQDSCVPHSICSHSVGL
ncbi:Hypothetical predicted protein [Drosophila guanche]|uniref:Uncharacterized protein n=1 Tax=Drosophila guanche TaxID=7266 RepID=A0A3B0JIX8_DROGU|nr:Hypothetical predicted protein [Drosophila guanche]